MIANLLIALSIALVSGFFASVVVVTIYHEEMRRECEEDPLLPIVIGEVVDDGE